MWSVVLLDEVDSWYVELARTDSGAAEAVTGAIDLLQDEGPTLGRPIVDRVKGSKRHNMKEIRPAGTSIRILFIFDPQRQAVLLVAGDKSGAWSQWYRQQIPVAEQRYGAWLAGEYDEEI